MEGQDAVILELERVQNDLDVTIGSLKVDGDWEAWTLEDPVREPKIYGETAIPAGRYGVEITHSPRFKRELPLLLNVDGFAGVRIHPGNTTRDTEGCILVGSDRYAKSIGRSRLAFDGLFAKLRAAKARGEKIELTIC
jgi:hypothetical protein